MPIVSSACQIRAKILLSNKRPTEIRENDKNNVFNRQATKQHHLLRYRRQKLRAIRHNLCRHGESTANTCPYSAPVFRSRSKLDFQESV